LNISAQATNLSDRWIESKLFCPNWNALTDRPVSRHALKRFHRHTIEHVIANENKLSTAWSDDERLSLFLPVTNLALTFPINPRCRPSRMRDRTNVITILNRRLPVDFLSQDVAIVFNCRHCRRRKASPAIALMSPPAAKIKGRTVTTLAICFIDDSWTKQQQFACLSRRSLYVVRVMLPYLSTSSPHWIFIVRRQYGVLFLTQSFLQMMNYSLAPHRLQLS